MCTPLSHMARHSFSMADQDVWRTGTYPSGGMTLWRIALVRLPKDLFPDALDISTLQWQNDMQGLCAA